MSFSIGIVGLPNIGKSTLFKALTRKEVNIDARPFTTTHVNIGIISVPDKRLRKIARIVKPELITPTTIEFVDIAGLVKNAYKGEGLGNKFLADIRNCHALIEILRAFEDQRVEHIEGNIDPLRDIEIIKTEFLMKDLETLENSFSKQKKEKKIKTKQDEKKLRILEKTKESVAKGLSVSELNLEKEEKEFIKEYRLLTEKPKIFILNINKPELPLVKRLKKDLKKFSVFNLKLEEEISELSNNELKELKIKSHLDRLILSCYDVLNLITFYTIAGGKETRAWTLSKGSKAPQAGGCVHSDFEKRFIKAEVLPWEKLVEIKSWNQARKLGLIKTVGKDYIVQDGEIIEFKI